jgi:aspartate racemase
VSRPLRQKTIGILGGMSNQATAEYYRLLNVETNRRLGGWEIAETVIVGVNFGNIEYFVRNNLWTEAGDYLASKAIAAQAAGADFLICVSNTMHRVAPRFTRDLEIPFIHIADPTGQAMLRAGVKRVGLLGTKPVMSAGFLKDYYSAEFSVDVLVPDEDEQREVDRIIFDELVRGELVPSSRQTYVRVCEGMRARGADGIILGCTEIFLLLTQNDVPGLQIFDTTSLHVQAAVEHAQAEA